MIIRRRDENEARAERERKKDYRRDVDERRPWILPLLVTLAVLAVVAVVGWWVLQRIG